MNEMVRYMRGYYIHFDARQTPGVAQKIDMQIRELRKQFEMSEIDVKAKSVSLATRVMRLLPGGYIQREYEGALQKLNLPDFVYIRRTTTDRGFLNFIKSIKQNFPKCKILIEIFTYPYDKDDFGKWNAWPYYFKDKYNRKKLHRYVERFVSYSEDETIFGVKSIPAINGIDVDAVSPVETEGRAEDETIHMIAVAYMQEHHGYERMIYGLDAYYKSGGKRKLVLHLVGDGPEKGNYEKLTRLTGLEEHVKFYPSTQGGALDELYNQADMAVSSLGVYKKGVHRLSALKTRECLAKGLPMITGCDVDVLMGTDYPYYCQFPNDATPIEIEKIVDFYDEVIKPKEKKEIVCEIRNFAYRTVDMSIAMKPIIDYIYPNN